MKITVNLSMAEILKLGKLVDADFANGFNTFTHTEDDVSFAIHRLINTMCDGDCENCTMCDDCDDDADTTYYLYH